MTFADLDVIIDAKSLLKHPFYIRWSEGKLTQSELKIYAKEYFHLVERIPGIVASLKERTKDPVLKLQIAENEREELEHVELWKRFAKSLGIGERELLTHKPSALAKQAVRSLEELAEGTFDDGLVAMYALEAELPKIAQSKKDGLTAFYGLTSEDAHIYFDEHLKEEKHLAVWRSQTLPPNAERPATVSLDAQNRLLDAVCNEAGIPLSC